MTKAVCTSTLHAQGARHAWLGYGWMDVGWDGEGLSIFDWAFSTDGGIAAGQTSEMTSVPGATGLAALALGAAGLRRRRNRSR